jgi:cysteine desulfurase
MSKLRTYLDHNATSPLKPAAHAAMLAALEVGGNASSVHAEGRAARALLDQAREKLAQALGVIAPMVVFTSGGSEANNLAIKGVEVERLIVSSIEHPSVLEAARESGLPVATIPVNANGIVELRALESLLRQGGKALVSVMLANNETGAIQPVRAVADLAAKYGALMHSDAVQAFGKVPVNFAMLGVDLMSISAHKLGGPIGAGALIVRDGLALKPLIHGGGQELRRRAGTENIAAVAGFAAAIEMSHDTSALRDLLESQLEDAEIFSRGVARLPNTTCFAYPAFSAETLLMNLDLDGIAVSSGSACSSGKVAKSHVLAAMGVAPDLAQGAIRVSLGWNTKEQDIARFIASLNRIKSRLAAPAAALFFCF